ncbi:heavy metal translocating P-type ATPase [Actinotalea sp.]|uniref:heavy metal translocating P-type ATPase n=1 Tax=Actinotalea sp. TaxID=1872145 RepID=UPI00356B0613
MVRRPSVPVVLFVVATTLLAAGGLAWLLDADTAARWTWLAGTALGLVSALATTLEAVRDRRPTVDVIAVLALAGAIWVDEPFAGAMITVMLATGRLLEAKADARARRELSLLVARAPRTAHRRTVDASTDTVVDVPVAEVVVGDHLLVRTGEVVPIDGRLLDDAVLDEAALTGESRPVELEAGQDVRSGVVNAGGPVELTATTTAEHSTYAGIVRLVEQAQATSAPFVRTADRVAVLFVPLTLVVAAVAWAVAGEPVRAVAVLVVATPCPLLLAAPIAIMSGLSRAAGMGVVIKGGSALERLATGTVLLSDKTGTLTQGRPEVTDVLAPEGVDPDEALRLAASLDQVSAHVLAGSVVHAARHRGLVLDMPSEVAEVHGYGIEGIVSGRRVRVGKAAWIVGEEVPRWIRQARRRADLDGSLTVFVGVDGGPACALLLSDPIRPDAPRTVRALREAGIEHIVLVTGDRSDIAEMVGRVVGVDAVVAEVDPEGKLATLARESARGPTIMVGDGINDAPALAAAGVGVALASRGATASSEAADVVLTVDRIEALADAILVARRSRRIAMRAVVVGMGLSLVAMVVAAAGHLPPAAGAALQEGIDLLAIAIALQAVLPARGRRPMPAGDISDARRLRIEHDAVLPLVERIRAVADGLTTDEPRLGAVVELREALQAELLPHERHDEAVLVPIVARALGGTDATVGLSRTHAEIEHQVGRLSRLVDGVEDEVSPEDVVELRRVLYGLYAVLRLHNAQEEELAFSLVPGAAPHRGPDSMTPPAQT